MVLCNPGFMMRSGAISDELWAKLEPLLLHGLAVGGHGGITV